MAHVIDESQIGVKASGRNRRFRAESDHAAPREPAFGDSAATGERQTDRRASESADDRGQGLALFVIFTMAVLIVTGAVALLALVDSWWMLGVAFAVDITVTTFVVLTIYRILAGRATRDRQARSQDLLPTMHPGQSDARDYLDPQPTPAVAQGGGFESHSSPPADSRPEVSMRPRVLMITDESLAKANEVPPAILPLVDQAEVFVVAPTLTTRLQSLTGDIDDARSRAQARLRTVFHHMHADGLEPQGGIGDEDQVAAIADALASFDADLMVLRLHAEGSKNENWRERRLAKRVRSHFDVPTIAFFFDGDGHVVSDGVIRARTAARHHRGGHRTQR